VKFDIYDGDEAYRFVLGKSGASPLAVFGINPSIADKCNSDPTINKVEKPVKTWGFDGFLMFNLYPFRTPNPDKLPDVFDAALANRNAETIQKYFLKSKARLAWAAWGDAFGKRNYFKDCLEKILRETKNLEWNRCESFTGAQNPRHPLSGQPHIITEQSHLTEFDVAEYLSRKKQS